MKIHGKSRILLSVMFLLSVLLYASAVYGDSYVVPAAPDAVGGICVYTGCNNYNHAQQLFEGSAFVGWTGPKLITQIAFRRNPDLTPNAFSLIFSNIEFSLSTTQVDAAIMASGGATDYAANRGPDVTVVRSGPFTLTSPSSGGTGVQPFDIVVEFTTPYLYDPSAGNLLIEWKNLGGDSYGGSSFSFDAGNASGPVILANMNDNSGFGESTTASTWGPSLTITEFSIAQGDSWETKKSMPTPITAQASGVIDGKLFIPSYDFSTYEAVLEVYNSFDDSWDTSSPSPPTKRTAAGAGVIDGKLYVAGGCENGTCNQLSKRLEVYDPGDDTTPGTWTTLADMQASRGAVAAAVIDGKLYVVGGFSPAWSPVDWLEVYDPVENMWTTLAPMPTPRESVEAAVIDGKLYVVGGYVRDYPGHQGTSTGILEVYDPGDDTTPGTWTTLTPMPTDRFAHAVGVINDKLYAVGGNKSGSGYGIVNTLEEYDPVANSWMARAPMPTARQMLAAGVIDGKLYAAGGDLEGTLEVYTPPGIINQPPVADAGPDQAIREGDIVSLDGSASFDDNTATENLIYAWTFSARPEGSTAILDGADTQSPSFEADVAGTYYVQLVVTDEGGLPSEQPDEVMISSDNLAPSAQAGDDVLVIKGNLVTLNGSSSTDPEDDEITYAWTLISSPAGSTATLTGADTETPSLTPDMEGLYVVQLAVSDFIGPSLPDSVEITATNAETFAEIKIQTASEAITGLPPSSVTTKGNQTAINNFLIQATAAIQAGRLTKAQDKLQKAIKRTDGCVLRGEPDGNGPGRDWITDCEAQVEAYNLLNDALAALTP